MSYLVRVRRSEELAAYFADSLVARRQDLLVSRWLAGWARARPYIVLGTWFVLREFQFQHRALSADLYADAEWSSFVEGAHKNQTDREQSIRLIYWTTSQPGLS